MATPKKKAAAKKAAPKKTTPKTAAKKTEAPAPTTAETPAEAPAAPAQSTPETPPVQDSNEAEFEKGVQAMKEAAGAAVAAVKANPTANKVVAVVKDNKVTVAAAAVGLVLVGPLTAVAAAVATTQTGRNALKQAFAKGQEIVQGQTGPKTGEEAKKSKKPGALEKFFKKWGP